MPGHRPEPGDRRVAVARRGAPEAARRTVRGVSPGRARVRAAHRPVLAPAGAEGPEDPRQGPARPPAAEPVADRPGRAVAPGDPLGRRLGRQPIQRQPEHRRLPDPLGHVRAVPQRRRQRARYEPAQHVGGDFFAYVPLSEGRLALVLADVSGKGVSAALVMAALSADVRYCLASERDLAKAVSLINESFLRGGWDDRFATLVVAVLDPRSHHVTLVSAGHLPVFLREASGRVSMIGTDLGCLPLGLDPTRGYKACELDMAVGSTLVFYTDGISEAMDHEQRLYGLERMEQVLRGPAQSAGDLGRRLLADVERHAAGQIRSDDMCLVCLGRLPAGR
ncbi:MAG: hypothetical protein EBX36_09000 [Planctomycetia bacterium]|nr:hypothetical protein [Planctomycetia bacterium]